MTTEETRENTEAESAPATTPAAAGESTSNGDAGEAPAEAAAAPEPAEAAAEAAEPAAPAESVAAPDAAAPAETPAEAPVDAAAAEAATQGGAVSAPAEGESSDASDDGEKKKKKRKRKKKKKKTDGDRKPQVFSHLFEGKPRAHAFRVGEVVAGRVDRVEDGAIVVDLFGKALAVADVYEPREIEATEDPSASEETSAGQVEAPASEETTDAAATAEAPAEPTAPTEPTDAPSEPTTVEAPSASAPATATEVAPTAEATEAAEPAADAAEAGASEDAGSNDETTATEAPAAMPEEPPPPPPEVGSIFHGRVGAVAESGHIAIINRNIDRQAAKARIAASRDARQRVSGLVFGFNRGGFDVIVEGIRTFCPASGMSLEPVTDPAAFVGRKLEFTLPPSKGGRSIIVSRRGVLEREMRKAARARLKALEVGQVIEGPVTEVRDYGLLVSLGEGLDGLVHQSECSWSRGAKTSDVAKVGDVVKVKVLKVQPASRKDRTGRVSLSIKACLPDPWDEHPDAVKVGAIHKGTITRTAEFGAFVEIAPGIEGLLHVTELGKKLAHAKEAVSEGETIDVMVDRVDRKERRLSLSKLSKSDLEAIEKGEFDPSVARSLKVGAIVKVVITRVEHHGMQAQVKGVVGRRGRAYIPNRELAIDDGPKKGKGGKRAKPIAQGSEVEVKVIGTDRDGSLRCSIKGKVRDEERRAVKEYRKEAAKQGFGTFGDLLKAKIGDD